MPGLDQVRLSSMRESDRRSSIRARIAVLPRLHDCPRKRYEPEGSLRAGLLPGLDEDDSEASGFVRKLGVALATEIGAHPSDALERREVVAASRTPARAGRRSPRGGRPAD